MTKQGSFLGRPVRGLQTMLRSICAVRCEIPSVIPDGVYGEDTMRAVAALQRYVGLPATGVADHATWDAVVSLYADSCEALQPPGALRLRAEPGAVIAPEEENLHLYLVQAMFEALGKIYENVPKTVMNGRNDGDCARALRWLQALSGLPETGGLDRRTWSCLTGLYRLSVNDGAIPQTGGGIL